MRASAISMPHPGARIKQFISNAGMILAMSQARTAAQLLQVRAALFKMKEKRGLELSFSMIFSIIVIIAIVAVAFYMISYLLKLKNCTELGLFGRDLQDTIDRAWNSDSA